MVTLDDVREIRRKVAHCSADLKALYLAKDAAADIEAVREFQALLAECDEVARLRAWLGHPDVLKRLLGGE